MQRLAISESNRLRGYLNNGRRLHGLCEIDVARLVAPKILRATFSRLVNTDQSWRRDQADAAIRATAPGWGLDPAAVWEAISDPTRAYPRPELELVAGEFWCLAADDIAKVNPVMDQVANPPPSHQCATFSRSLPWHLLDDEVVRPLLRYLTSQWCADPEDAYSSLLEVTEGQREAFMLSQPANPLRPPLVCVPISSLLDLLNLQAPFDVLEFETVAAALESVAVDAVLQRGVLVTVINDLASPAANAWSRQHRDLESVTMVGDDLLIVRRRDRFCWRIFARQRNPAWSTLHSFFRPLLIEAVSHACHTLSTDASAAFLLELVKVVREGRNDDRSKFSN